MSDLSRRVRELVPSGTLAVKAEADRLRAAGEDVIDFGPGEPDSDTPAAIREAAKRALDAGDTRYGEVAGKAALRSALAEQARQRWGGSWTEREVVVGVGAKGVLFLLMQALLDPGDEVLVPSPYWVSFPEQVRLAGARPVEVAAREEDGFVPLPQDVEARAGPATRALLLNSPNNPTGAVIPAGCLERLAELAARRDLWLISDETYDRFCYPGHPFASAAALRGRSGDRVVVVNSFSKTYAMTGWRVGYALAPAPVAAAVSKLQGHDATHPASFAQAGALEALRRGETDVSAMVARYQARRDLMVDGLAGIPGVTCSVPGGAFYVFPSVRGLCRRAGVDSSAGLAERLIRQARIAVVPGEAFGRGGYVRLSYALAEERIREGMRRLREFAEGA